MLEALARIMRALPNQVNSAFVATVATDVEDIAAAVARDAGLDPTVMALNSAHLGSEWDHILVPVLFTGERKDRVLDALRGTTTFG